MIAHINTVTLYVSDQDKARDFYVEHLGFRVRKDEDMGPMGRWLEVAPEAAQTAFVLANASAFGKQDRIGASADLVLHSSDVAGLHQRLTAAGVTVTDPEVQAWARLSRSPTRTGWRSSSASPDEPAEEPGHGRWKAWREW